MANIDNLFEIMAKKRISQKELAVAINASTGNVSDWKKGRSFPSAQKLDEAATFLECSVDYLLGRTDSPQGVNQINTGDVGDHSNVNVHNEKKTTDSDSDDTVSELVAVFKTLNFYDKAKVMSLIAELSNK